MTSSRLINTHKIENHTQISPKELAVDIINTYDIDNLNEVTSKLHKKFLSHALIMILFCGLAFILLNSQLKDSSNIFTKESIFLYLFTLCMVLLELYLLTQFIRTRKGSYKKAQYGKVQGKYVLKNNDSRKYYINVVFAENNTFIKNVICTEEIYNTIEVNDNILVVSYDNKTCYSVPIN